MRISDWSSDVCSSDLVGGSTFPQGQEQTGNLGLCERLPEQLVHHGGIGLAAAGLHRLTNEEAEQLVLAAAIFGDLVGVGGYNLGDDGLDRAGIGDRQSDELGTCVYGREDVGWRRDIKKK